MRDRGPSYTPRFCRLKLIGMSAAIVDIVNEYCSAQAVGFGGDVVLKVPMEIVSRSRTARKLSGQ